MPEQSSNNPAKLPLDSHNPPYTPRSSTIPDDSDSEFDPTPIHSPGGPQYDDLPPSYDEAQEQAVTDARNGVTPLDPNQLEAHRLTLNEGPNEPEVWEYRLRGEQPDETTEHEPAPEYGRTIPIQHIQTSSSIPVNQSTTRTDLNEALLATALRFTHHEPDADAQYAPRLARPIAIPQEHPPAQRRASEGRCKGRKRASSSEPAQPCSDHSAEPAQFLRAYAKALHTHSIRPAEFTEFLDNLNVLCKATNMTTDDLLHHGLPSNELSSIAHDYIKEANASFFAPRGLKVSLQSSTTLIENLKIPTERGQQAGVLAGFLDPTSTPEKRAQALYPWIENLDTNVPSPDSQVLLLRAMSDRLVEQSHLTTTSSLSNQNFMESGHSVDQQEQDHEDPPHSVPEPVEGDHRSHGRRGRGRHGRRGREGHRGEPWSPFGRSGHGPFGPRNHGPFGPPNHGPFGPHGNGPFGRSTHGPFGPGRFGPGGPPHYGRGHTRSRSNEFNSSQHPNEWAAWGENFGKMGEEFGKRMGEWGQQFGKRAEAWGQEVGRAAEAWGQDVSARASGSSSQARNRPSSADAQFHDHHLPDYSEGSTHRETGVIYEKGNPIMHDAAGTKEKGEGKKIADDDDASSLSSDSSDSDSDSDSDVEDYPDNEAIFLKRIRSINENAELALKKGKKSPKEIAQERDLAIEKAQHDKDAMDVKIEEKQTKRAIKLSLSQKSRELKKHYRQQKHEMKEKQVGKGKGKAKKSKEWKETKKEYRENKKELRKEKMKARKEWRESKHARRMAKREKWVSDDYEREETREIVLVVVENLHA